jgi:hypothetical protein
VPLDAGSVELVLEVAHVRLAARRRLWAHAVVGHHGDAKAAIEVGAVELVEAREEPVARGASRTFKVLDVVGERDVEKASPETAAELKAELEREHRALGIVDPRIRTPDERSQRVDPELGEGLFVRSLDGRARYPTGGKEPA